MQMLLNLAALLILFIFMTWVLRQLYRVWCWMQAETKQILKDSSASTPSEQLEKLMQMLRDNHKEPDEKS